ncbi:phage major capsid protein [Streptomyces caniscabiei]|uniref:Phage major capsid protein n=1 Tax=Streptomyces caniscabiei TaxID=2746961 RepID=A0A927KZX1_9ACTN|nr:phage major capsid protein [Streptomyces caniscabiei]MBD9723451.1 phage major capsid protein [Streptomyces caniscabiei]MDX3516051.1 phage major capsid protein [Streptomyces caniscabiei]MDX3725143.1 phage major capsid protein [Streptomyces caniscabiei]WEO27021.1 phage major capsid protein [Streptomyces caniscabiei]
MTTTLATPRNSDELAEMLADPKASKDILQTKDSLQAFIENYAQKQQGDGTDLQRQIESETQRQLAAMLRENDVKNSDRDAIKRLNLDPQTRPANMLTSHKQATAYNPKAVGTALDGKFDNAADYFRHAWHLNRDPQQRAKMDEIRNAYSSVVPADGGFLVPETLRSQLLQIALESSVVRSRATVVPMETARVPFPMIDSTTNVGSVFGGMIGYWGEEGAALVESNPKFGRAELDAKKLTGFALVPNELLQDSLISFSALIETLWPQALAFFEDLAFMSGSGAGEPLGFLGSGNSAGVAVDKESGQAADTIVVENVIKMYSRMLPSSLARGIWVCSPEAIPELYTMALSVGTGGGPVMLTNVTGPAPMTIFGRPLVVSEKAGRLGDRSDLAFVDLSYYLIGDRQQMTAASSTEYKFGEDKTAFRIIQRVDGRPWLQSAITPANGGPNLSPFVEIAERA